MYADEWFTTAVGAGAEQHLLSTPGDIYVSGAFCHDLVQSVKLFHAWCEFEIQMGRVPGTVGEHLEATFHSGVASLRVNRFICRHWWLIDLSATTFLVYGNRQGQVSQSIIDALTEVVRERLTYDSPIGNRSTSPLELRSSLGEDVLPIWRKHTPRADFGEWMRGTRAAGITLPFGYQAPATPASNAQQAVSLAFCSNPGCV
jgi:hypothetical protein